MNIKPFLLWLPMIVLAFANAMLRELVIIKHYREFRAHQLSTLSLIILCSVYVWFVFPVLHIQNPRQAFLIGLVWVGLTIVFEFTLGRSTNKTWEYLLRDYNLPAGRLWPLFLFVLFLMPYLYYLIKSK